MSVVDREQTVVDYSIRSVDTHAIQRHSFFVKISMMMSTAWDIERCDNQTAYQVGGRFVRSNRDSVCAVRYAHGISRCVEQFEELVENSGALRQWTKGGSILQLNVRQQSWQTQAPAVGQQYGGFVCGGSDIKRECPQPLGTQQLTHGQPIFEKHTQTLLRNNVLIRCQNVNQPPEWKKLPVSQKDRLIGGNIRLIGRIVQPIRRKFSPASGTGWMIKGVVWSDSPTQGTVVGHKCLHEGYLTNRSIPIIGEIVTLQKPDQTGVPTWGAPDWKKYYEQTADNHIKIFGLPRVHAQAVSDSNTSGDQIVLKNLVLPVGSMVGMHLVIFLCAPQDTVANSTSYCTAERRDISNHSSSKSEKNGTSSQLTVPT